MYPYPECGRERIVCRSINGCSNEMLKLHSVLFSVISTSLVSTCSTGNIDDSSRNLELLQWILSFSVALHQFYVLQTTPSAMDCVLTSAVLVVVCEPVSLWCVMQWSFIWWKVYITYPIECQSDHEYITCPMYVQCIRWLVRWSHDWQQMLLWQNNNIGVINEWLRN